MASTTSVDYLLDTNVLLRTVDPRSTQHPLAKQAIHELSLRRHRLLITAQTLIEFWAVATRPVAVNGLGWDYEPARQELGEIQKRFPLLPDSPLILQEWLRLLATTRFAGKRVHDARLAAVMFAHGVTHLLTFNVEHFQNFPGLTVISPASISASTFPNT